MRAVLALLLVSLGLVLFHTERILVRVHTAKAVERARALTVFCEEIRNFISGYHGRGMFDDPALASEAAVADARHFRETRLYRTIPVVAAWTAAGAKADELGYRFRVPRTQPRNPDNEPRPGVESAVVRFLEGTAALDDIRAAGARIVFPENPEAASRTGEIGVIHTGDEIGPDGLRRNVDAIRFFRAIRLSADCLSCHGEPAGTPDPLGFPREGWKTGEVRGAFEIVAPLGPMRAELRKTRRNLIVGAAILFLLAGSAFWALTRRLLERPIREVVRFSERLGAGDFRWKIPVRTDDEIGVMSRHLNASADRLREMATRVSGASTALSGTSGDLSGIASELADSARRLDDETGRLAVDTDSVSDFVTQVAEAAEATDRTAARMAEMAERMSAGSESVSDRARRTDERVARMARSGEEMRGTVAGVAVAAEEMTASLYEVAGHTDRAREISREASERTSEIVQRMAVLRDASGRIGRVVALIRKIAGQTHLLALNATIEAAGAGAAGRGFAVVAGEVKALARSSAEAAGEIASQVEAIQEDIAAAVSDVEAVSVTIGRLAEINGAIAMAAGEQSDAAADISRRTAENARLADGVSRMGEEAAGLVAEIARGADESARAAAELARGVEAVSARAGEGARGSADAAGRVAEMGAGVREIRTAAGRAREGAERTAAGVGELERVAAGLMTAVGAFRLEDADSGPEPGPDSGKDSAKTNREKEKRP